MTEPRQKKLFRVEIEHTMYVMAETEYKAEREAVRNLWEEGEVDCATETVESMLERGVSAAYLRSSGWGEDIPYGSDDYKTVDELVKELAEKAKG